MKNISSDNPIVCWFSGGITSAVACKIALDMYGKDNCVIIFIDTRNEDDDTYRFLHDCEKWYDMPIESITNEAYDDISAVWRKFKGLNFAHGAICSSELKRAVRLKWQKENKFRYQVFGFDINEPKRVKGMAMNYPEANPIFPLLMFGMTKKQCIKIIMDAGIDIPRAYKLGLQNNNCLKTGCVQGGIGYWQLIRKIMPEQFNTMAAIEHELTNLKGSPVTMLKDQSRLAKEGGNNLVFLKPHPDYPLIKHIGLMKGREPKPLTDCNGFCGINDLERNPTETEINNSKL